MVFRARGANTFKLRVLAPSGASATLSTGCQVRGDAEDVEAVVKRWRGDKGKRFARPDVLEAVVAKRVPLLEAYEAHQDGTLDALMARLAAEASDVDLAPHVAQWHARKAGAKKGAASADDYRRQLRTLYPDTEPFTLSMFARKELLARLHSLDVDGPTKNRYKAAASSFAQYLLDAELLEHNFVRTIPSFGENDERVVYFERADAKRLVAGLAQPYSAVAAIMCGFALEWGAVERLTVADVELDAEPPRVLARGTKRAWRHRTVPLVPENAWVLPFIRPALAGKLPTALVFPGVPQWRTLRLQYDAQEALNLHAVGADRFGPHSLHDWRHTHAVQLLRDGYDEQIAAAHLGHKNTDLVRKRYGVFKPTAHDYAKPAATKRKRDVK